MKKVIVPLVVVAAVVSIMLAGCVPGAAPEAPPTVPLAPAGAAVPGGNLPLNPYEGLGIKPDGTPYKFAVSPIYLHCDWEVNAEGLFRSLITRSGAEYKLCDPNLDMQRQIDFVEDLIAVSPPDGLFFQPVEPGMSVIITEKAMDAGIPVIAWTLDIPTEKKLAFVGHKFDGPNGTNVVGEYFVWVAEETGEQLNIYEVWGERAVPSCVERHDGFHNAVDPCPLITVMESPDSHWSDEIACDLVIDAFTAHPELNGLFVHGGGCTGAVEGLNAIGRLVPKADPNHVYIATADPDYRISQLLATGLMDACGSHDARAVADVSTKLMFTHVILGQPVPKKVIIPLKLITTENMYTEKLFGDLLLYTLMPVADWDLWPPLDTREIGIETPTWDMVGTGYNPCAGALGE